MSSNKRILCIVAGQRAGTTALQSALASTGKFYDFGEIFQTTAERRKGAFLDYARARNLQIADTAAIDGAITQIEAYLESLREMAGATKFPLIDVKLNSWGAFRSFWGYMHQEPPLLSVLKRQGSRFIFVARRDITAQVMSEQIARHAGKWHQLSDAEILRPMRMNAAAAANQARLIILAEETLFGLLKNTGKVFAVWYEDLYVEGAVKASLKDWLNRDFELTLKAPPAPVIARNQVNKQAAVENYDEVERAIAGVVKRLGRVEFTSS